MSYVTVDAEIDLDDLKDEIRNEFCNEFDCLCPRLLTSYEDKIKELISELKKELYVYTTKSNITIEDIIRKLKNIIE